jgi:hypothetical protein
VVEAEVAVLMAVMEDRPILILLVMVVTLVAVVLDRALPLVELAEVEVVYPGSTAIQLVHLLHIQ